MAIRIGDRVFLASLGWTGRIIEIGKIKANVLWDFGTVSKTGAVDLRQLQHLDSD